MSARMDVTSVLPIDPIDIVEVPVPPAPPPPPQTQADTPRHVESVIDRPRKQIELPTLPSLPLDQGAPVRDPYVPPAILPPVDPPKPESVRVAARFATPADLVRPPYPLAKLRAEEEATLRLRLTIDARGRVTSVEPVGAADPQFLEAARRHIIKSWRYKPATEDGAAKASSTVITLSFRLEEA
ncbi:MAG TPA: energy transducer TonB, partial [Sphingomicrobium sp.]|nr:energy transducer TonB [Sphingomicrobium sp.]